MDIELLWEATLGLIIEDGWIAVGAIGALGAAWTIAQLARGQENQEMVNLAGPLLMAMVLVLILSNLYSAGRSAAGRKVD